jgi:hypothetical protein
MLLAKGSALAVVQFLQAKTVQRSNFHQMEGRFFQIQFLLGENNA